MPIYEYRCLKCEHTFEKLQRPDDKASCPECKSKKVKKLLSSFASMSTVSAMPTCEGSRPACSPDICGSGACGMGGMG